LGATVDYIRDALFLVGVAIVGTGTGFIDWRYGLITGGSILVAVTVLSYARGMR